LPQNVKRKEASNENLTNRATNKETSTERETTMANGVQDHNVAAHEEASKSSLSSVDVNSRFSVLGILGLTPRFSAALSEQIQRDAKYLFSENAKPRDTSSEIHRATNPLGVRSRRKAKMW
jgi:hypothetical protein